MNRIMKLEENPTQWINLQLTMTKIKVAALEAEVKRLRLAFITAVRHVGEYNISIDDLFDIIDEDLVKMYQKHHNDDE